jgi:hypothetical protein
MSDRSTEDQGVVYVAHGEKYIDEAIKASHSVRKHNPNLPICLISDSDKQIADFDHQVYAARQKPVIRGKLEMFKSPYARTLFLDTDTLVFDSLGEIFELLRVFDIVFEQGSGGYHYKLDGVPHAFPEPNTGVIGFTKSTKLEDFAKLWEKYFDAYVNEMQREWDQRSFRHAVYVSNLRHSVLTPEYNFMPYFPQFAMGHLRIIHGRPPNKLLELKEVMDKTLGPRAHIPRIGCVGHYNHAPLASLLAVACNAMKVFATECGKRTVKWTGLYPVAQRMFGVEP